MGGLRLRNGCTGGEIFSGRMMMKDFRDRKDDQDLIALVKHLIAKYRRCIEWKMFVGLARVLSFTGLLWAVRNMLISHSTTTMKTVELQVFHSDHHGCCHRGTEHFCLADTVFEAGRSSCCELPLEEVSEVCNCWNLKLTELPIIDIDSPVPSSMCWSCFFPVGLWPTAKDYADRNIFDDWAPRPSARPRQKKIRDVFFIGKSSWKSWSFAFFDIFWSGRCAIHQLCWAYLPGLKGMLLKSCPLSGLVVSTRPATANFGRLRSRPDPLA